MDRRTPNWKRTLFALAALLLSGSALAAQTTITGRVTSGGNPLENALVALPDVPGFSARTDAQGNYRLVANTGSATSVVVLARAVGYRPVRQSIALSNREGTATFALERDILNLDQVVVTGVSDAISTRKTAFSVGVVDAAQLKEAPATSALGGLNGRVAGASVTAGSGAPGSAPSIRLRGATSLTGRQDPLIIIDGTISRISLADVNAEDIERIEVIKGAAASSLYGSDAANGVVQIFTKSGRDLAEGRTELMFRNEFGSNAIRRTIPNNMTHAWQINADSSFVLDVNGERVIEPDEISDNPYRETFDQLGQVYSPGFFMTNYISMAQRRGNTSLNVSFQNTRDEGILNLLGGFTRRNFRVNASTAVNEKLDLQTGAFFGTSYADQPDEGQVFFGLRMLEPNVDLTADSPDGTPFDPRVVQSGRTSNASNPLYSAANQQNDIDRSRFTGFAKATFRPLSWLTAEGNANYDTGDQRSKFFTPLGFIRSSGARTSGNLQQNQNETRTYNLGASLTAVRDFGVFTNTTKAAWVYEDQRDLFLTVFAPAFAVSRVPEFSGIRRDPLTAPVTTTSNTQNIRNNNLFLISTFDIQDKLILDGLIRQDNSSLFGEDQRTAYYYRASAAYRVSQDFDLPKVDEFKLRASIGTAGLRPPYEAQYEQFLLEGGRPVKVTLGNPDLRPAQSREVELGFNIDFLRKFTFEYSYSNKLTVDQILNAPASVATGYRNQWVNAGSLRAITNEIALGAVLAQRGDFFWRLNVTADRTRQKVEELNVSPFSVGPDINDDNTRIFWIQEGETFGTLYGTRWIRTAEQMQAAIDNGGYPGETMADFVRNEEGYYVRQDLWRTIDEAPLKYFDETGNNLMKIGDVNPDFNLAFNSQMNWGNFSVTAVVNWVQGGDIYNFTRKWPFFDLRDPVIDQSNKPEIEKKSVRYYSNFYNNLDPSDYFIENGTYIRLRELAVNYSLPSVVLDRVGLGGRTVRLGIVGRNLLTLTDYSGYDPDVSGPGGGNPFGYRVDYFTYPVFRTFTAMVEIGF